MRSDLFWIGVFVGVFVTLGMVAGVWIIFK